MKNSGVKIVTRFAPSPTGFMHVGGVRTALFSWLWARKHEGTFILRIEDTDKEREVPGSIDHIKASLRWLGITWDEGPEVGGPHGPYIQSERLALYRKYAEELIKKGHAYPDPYTIEEVDNFRKRAETEKRPFLYRENRPQEESVWDGTKPLRFKVPEIKSYRWHDLVRGELSAGEEALDDFVLIKSDGYPTYNFAHIVDDIEMGVTHVMRGEEFISSTPKFLSVYDALGITPPAFATLPVILAEGGNKKLGKRDGAKDILDYKEEGYLPEAMVNFLALLGWNPGTEQEIFTSKELIESFDISRVQKAGAQMNLDKLDWMNKEHMRKLSDLAFYREALPYLPKEIRENPKFSEAQFQKITPLLKERVSTFSDITKMAEAEELGYYFFEPTYDAAKLIWKDSTQEKTTSNLEAIIPLLEAIPPEGFTEVAIKEAIWDFATKEGRGSVLWPMRYALSGKETSPDPFVLGTLLGKEETVKRLKNAILSLR